MRRAMRLMLIGLMLLLFLPPAAAEIHCTWTGTPRRDVHYGTPEPDILCGLGGDDYLNGKGGDDVVRGGHGRDTLVGGKGHDLVRGDKDKDRLFAAGDTGGDQVYAGKGFDRCYLDPGDRVFDCEDVRRG